jgi:hypothetical protein
VDVVHQQEQKHVEERKKMPKGKPAATIRDDGRRVVWNTKVFFTSLNTFLFELFGNVKYR